MYPLSRFQFSLIWLLAFGCGLLAVLLGWKFAVVMLAIYTAQSILLGVYAYGRSKGVQHGAQD